MDRVYNLRKGSLLFIDIELKEMGWRFGCPDTDAIKEYLLTGMSTKSSSGIKTGQFSRE